MKPPPGYDIPDGHVLLLLRSLYGLRNAPRIWFQTLSSSLKDLGFTQSELDPCLWHLQDGELYILVVFVVDDIMIGSSDADFTRKFIQEFRQRYKITDMGQPEYILVIIIFVLA